MLPRGVGMRDFRELKVWEKGHRLTLAAYRATAAFPRHELFGMTSQIRRCSYSIPANIAEGCGRESRPDFARFLQIAMGSASELEYFLILALDLGYLTDNETAQLAETVVEIKRMLTALIRKLGEDRDML